MIASTPTRQERSTRSISAYLIAAAATIALLYFGRGFLITLVIAVMFAFILDPAVSLLVRFRLPRSFASFLICGGTAFLFYLAGLGLYFQAVSFVDDLPSYSQRLNELTDNVSRRLETVERNATQLFSPKRPATTPETRPATPEKGRGRRPAPATPIVPPPIQEVRIRPEPTPILSYVYEYVSGMYDVLLLASFVPFLVYFMLSWRDHTRRSFIAMFQGSAQDVAGQSWHDMGEVARAYVVGNFLLGGILTGVSALTFWLLGVPYWPLAGALSGFLSLMPYLGLPLSALPPLLAALPVYRGLGPYALILFLTGFYHLLALNLLYPKFVGARVHLNPLTVTIALMFWGTVWGGIGLILAIPLTAALKAVCDNVTKLRPIGQLLGDGHILAP